MTAALFALSPVGNTATAQPDTATVPDLTGLTAPQAARALGLAKLAFGAESSLAWTADARVQRNQVRAQDPAAGSKVAPGSAVNITVLRVYNAALRIETDSLTLRNLGDTPLDLGGVVFKSADGSRQFDATGWGRSLPAKKCDQLWTVQPPRATPSAECGTPNRAIVAPKVRQFWVESGFRIERYQDEIATCPASAPSCEIALPQGDDPERTAYMLFSYRTNHLEIRNDSERWMGLNGAQAVGSNGVRLDLHIPPGGTTPGDVPWSGSRLAPGQCLVLSELEVAALPPFDCAVVGYVRLKTGGAFWTRGFALTGPSGRRGLCAAPRPGLQSLCWVPR
jgi:hypothetical protein